MLFGRENRVALGQIRMMLAADEILQVMTRGSHLEVPGRFCMMLGRLVMTGRRIAMAYLCRFGNLGRGHFSLPGTQGAPCGIESGSSVADAGAAVLCHNPHKTHPALFHRQRARTPWPVGQGRDVLLHWRGARDRGTVLILLQPGPDLGTDLQVLR